MPVIPDEQIAQYARNAGFANGDLPTMVAIALAESGGDTSAMGDLALETQEWGPSVGLWQIRSLNAEKGKGTARDETANLDPQTNAVHAKSIKDSQGLGAWSTYSRGTYALYMNRGTAAASNVGPAGTVPTQTVGNPLSVPGLDSLKTLLGNLTDVHYYARAGVILGGLLIIVLGVVAFIGPEKIGGAVGKAAAIAV